MALHALPDSHAYALYFVAPAADTAPDSAAFAFHLTPFEGASRPFRLERVAHRQGAHYVGAIYFQYPARGFIVRGPDSVKSPRILPFHRVDGQIVLIDSIAPGRDGRWRFFPADTSRRAIRFAYAMVPPLRRTDSLQWRMWANGRLIAEQRRRYTPTRAPLPVLWRLPDEWLDGRCDSITLTAGEYHLEGPCGPSHAWVRAALRLLTPDELADLAQWSEYRAEAADREYRLRAPTRADSVIQLAHTFRQWFGRAAYRKLQEALAAVQYVNRTFGTIHQRGIYTDRGRVFIQYGPPSDTWGHEFDPGALPYQIWKYNVTARRGNVIFVFYNPTGIDNEYELIHSNAFGELNNPRWRHLIYQRFPKPNDINDPGRRDYFGGGLELFR